MNNFLLVEGRRLHQATVRRSRAMQSSGFDERVEAFDFELVPELGQHAEIRP